MRRLFVGLLVLLGLSLPGAARAQESPLVVRVGAYINDVLWNSRVSAAPR